MHEGGPTPPALRDKPKLPQHLLFYWNCFMALAHDRQIYMGGVTQIPFTALTAWADRYGVFGDAFDRLARLVRAMDRVWLADVDERVKAAGSTRLGQ